MPLFCTQGKLDNKGGGVQYAHVYDRQLVRDIQTALNEQGYNAGKPDGLYGPGTRKAIAAYQQDKGLAVVDKGGR